MTDQWRMDGPDAGDIFDPYEIIRTCHPPVPGNRVLILPEFSVVDLGLLLNEKEGSDFWKAGECIQFHGCVRGVEVWIQEYTGRMSIFTDPSYRVAFGANPEYPPMISVDEASRLIKANIPPIEYVHVTPEMWAHRRDGE